MINHSKLTFRNWTNLINLEITSIIPIQILLLSSSLDYTTTIAWQDFSDNHQRFDHFPFIAHKESQPWMNKDTKNHLSLNNLELTARSSIHKPRHLLLTFSNRYAPILQIWYQFYDIKRKSDIRAYLTQNPHCQSNKYNFNWLFIFDTRLRTHYLIKKNRNGKHWRRSFIFGEKIVSPRAPCEEIPLLSIKHRAHGHLKRESVQSICASAIRHHEPVYAGDVTTSSATLRHASWRNAARVTRVLRHARTRLCPYVLLSLSRTAAGYRCVSVALALWFCVFCAYQAGRSESVLRAKILRISISFVSVLCLLWDEVFLVLSILSNSIIFRKVDRLMIKKIV